MRGHGPSRDVFEGGAKLLVLIVEARLFHRQTDNPLSGTALRIVWRAEDE